MKLFVAITVPQSITDYLIRLQTVLQERACQGCRFVDPELFHCTLVFIGVVTPKQCSTIMNDLSDIHVASCLVESDEVVTFSHDKKRSVYALALRSPGLSELRTIILERLSWMEFDADTSRAFIPHVTFARCSNACWMDASTLPAVDIQFEVASWVLMNSSMVEYELVYSVLKRYEMRNTL